MDPRAEESPSGGARIYRPPQECACSLLAPSRYRAHRPTQTLRAGKGVGYRADFGGPGGSGDVMLAAAPKGTPTL